MEYTIAAVALVSLSIGIFLGHAAGYARAKRVERARALRFFDRNFPNLARLDAVVARPRYRRVGSPE